MLSLIGKLVNRKEDRDRRFAVDFWRRLPFAMVDDDGVVLEDFTKLKSFIIDPPNIEGIGDAELAHETGQIANMIKILNAPSAFLQFSTIVSNDISSVTDKYKDISKHNIVLSALADERIKLMNGSVEYKTYLTVAIPLFASVTVDGKKKRFYDSDDFNARDRAMFDAEKLIIDTYTPMNYGIKPVSGYDFMSVVASVINPLESIPDMDSCDYSGKIVPIKKRLFLSDFWIDKNYITNGKYKFVALVMDVQPTPIPTMTGSKILRELNFPVVYNYTILHEDQDRVFADLDRQRSLSNIFSGGKSAASANNKEKIRAINQIKEDKAKEGWKLLRTFNSFLVWDADEKELNNKISTIRTVAGKILNGSGVYTEVLRKESSFIASIPGCATRSYDMLFMPSKEAVGMIPMRLQYKGDRDAPVLMHKNRWHGITAVNPFSKKQNRWAGIFVGPSGSGKSVTVNSFVFGTAALDPFIFIVDMATEPSYEPVVTLLGGSMSRITMNDDSNRVNMFDLRVGFEEPMGLKILSLDAMLTAMIADEEQKSLPKETQSVVQRAIKRLYQRYFKEEDVRKTKSIKIPDAISEQIIKDAPEFDYFLEYRDYYIKKFLETNEQSFFKKAEMAQCLATPTLTDFAMVLSRDEALTLSARDREIAENIRRILSLYTQGPQALLFNGTTNFTVENDVYCFHLGLVKERKEFLSMLLLLYRDFAFRKSVFFNAELPPFIVESRNVEWIVKMQKRMKLYVYDEFHNLKNNAPVLDILDKDARQQRTLGMATYLVTQDIRDIAGTGKNFLDASANKYFFRHIDPSNPSMDALKSVQDILGLTSAEVELLKSLVFYPGQYAEVLAMNEGLGIGVMQIVNSQMERWLYTSHKDERFLRDAVIKELQNRGMHRYNAVVTATQALSRKYPDGAIGKNANITDVLNFIESNCY